MLDWNTLEGMWAGEGQRRAGGVPLRYPEFTDQGLELGARTIVARALTSPDGSRSLDLDKDAERAQALLATAYARPIGRRELEALRAASKAWTRGDLSLAHIVLAQAGLGRLDGGGPAPKNLYTAEKLLAWGLSPRDLLKGLDLLPNEGGVGKASPDDPKHPGWPAGTAGGLGGKFRPKDGGGDDGGTSETGGDGKTPSDEPPKIPTEAPADPKVRNAIIRIAIRFLVHTMELGEDIAAPEIVALQAAAEAATWAWPYISAYFDKPKSLDELRAAVDDPEPGYEIHHIVEQTPAEQDGFSRDEIDDPDNLVRISSLKHREITAWYQTPDKEYGGLSPRDYLRGKDWNERMSVGLYALRKFGVLAP